MRVLQLIDSLHAGGAERVAVNIANGLSSKIDKSFICTTRDEGLLKNSINSKVEYLFLNKKKTLDIKAINRLSKFVKRNNISIIHAHSSSFFTATIIRFLNKKVKIIWHDHYGNSEFLEHRKSFALKICSKYFSHIFSVNTKLKHWAENYLKTTKVSYLPNFAIKNNEVKTTNLEGLKHKRIICLANLRPQKDHFTLLKAFKKIVLKKPEWSLHLVGKDFQDKYATDLKELISSFKISNNVYLYGSKADITNILDQSDIAVLSSVSEGLPIALLEYGLAKLPVIATRVGECESVITNGSQGVLIPPRSIEKLAEAFEFYIQNTKDRQSKAKALNAHVLENFSKKAIIKKILKAYANLV